MRSIVFSSVSLLCGMVGIILWDLYIRDYSKAPEIIGFEFVFVPTFLSGMLAFFALQKQYLVKPLTIIAFSCFIIAACWTTYAIFNPSALDSNSVLRGISSDHGVVTTKTTVFKTKAMWRVYLALLIIATMSFFVNVFALPRALECQSKQAGRFYLSGGQLVCTVFLLANLAFLAIGFGEIADFQDAPSYVRYNDAERLVIKSILVSGYMFATLLFARFYFSRFQPRHGLGLGYTVSGMVAALFIAYSVGGIVNWTGLNISMDDIFGLLFWGVLLFVYTLPALLVYILAMTIAVSMVFCAITNRPRGVIGWMIKRGGTVDSFLSA